MTRFKRAIIGFMVIANLGIYSAFALWVMVDGGLPTMDVIAALGEPTDARAARSSSASPTPAPVSGLAIAPTPGWTPPAIALAPLPTAAAPADAPLDAGPNPTAGPAPTETPDNAATLPASARVTGVVGHRQKLSLSCEARSAADWAAFFGVAIDEMEFLSALPLSDDPDRGFVGDVNGEWGNLPPQAYGVHAPPVARMLRGYGLPAESRRYLEWDDLRAEIAAGRPVLVWVIGHTEDGEGVIYTAGDGRRTIVARFEHTVILVGYDEDGVTVVDGVNTYRRPLARFLASWGALRNMAITAAP